MKIFAFAALALLSSAAFADDQNQPQQLTKPNPRASIVQALQQGVTKTQCPDAQGEKDGHQGCCSHHSGVCGCSGGHAMCCDGAQSPTCGCD